MLLISVDNFYYTKNFKVTYFIAKEDIFYCAFYHKIFFNDSENLIYFLFRKVMSKCNIIVCSCNIYYACQDFHVKQQRLIIWFPQYIFHYVDNIGYKL